MNTQEKIAALRTEMQECGMDGFIIPKADEFQGEFVAPYAERLKWLTGFTGSAGVAVVLMEGACVLSDARYTLQLEQQIDGDLFEVADSVKIGAAGWLKDHAPDGGVIGFDPWLHTPDQIQKIRDDAPELTLKPIEKNLIDAIWSDQPEKPLGAVQRFSKSLAGKSFIDKKKVVSAAIQKQGATAAIITLPDSIAWLLNMRGADINYIPSILSYLIVYADETQPVQWVIDPEKVAGLDLAGVEIATLDILQTLSGSVILDFARSPEWFRLSLEENGVEIINAKDPSIDFKAIKTPQEFEALKAAHILDGIALTKFLYWASCTENFTEVDVDTKLQELRAQQPGYKGPSFPTIAGFAANGAVVHYRAGEETGTMVTGDGLLLVDSGGQYYDEDAGIAGTTDITRTFAIGAPTDEMRNCFTLVLKGHIALAMAQFSEGTTGKVIDELARTPLWNAGLDFAHGTGHGVGCYLAVHEEAASISPRGKDALKAGMLISNEPGYYKAGEYGIRIENLVFVKEAGEGMLEFETVSFAPIDRALIVSSLLDENEIRWLNDYHAQIYKVLEAGLDAQEREWLKHQTAPL